MSLPTLPEHQKAESDRLRAELAAVRELLREAHSYMTDQPWDLQQRIDAALAKEKP